MNTDKIISRLSLVAGLCVLTMFLIAVFTGVSQEQFEVTRNADLYTKSLLAAENALRLTFTIDIIFICVFTAIFVFLAQRLKTGDVVTDMAANVALGSLVICGLLDFHEDLHILTMLRSAANNLPIGQSEIEMRMLFSMIKFCASYFGLFLLSFILPHRTPGEKFLRYSLMFFFVPIGALVYTAPETLQPVFGLIRFVFMAIGFFLLAHNFSPKD